MCHRSLVDAAQVIGVVVLVLGLGTLAVVHALPARKGVHPVLREAGFTELVVVDGQPYARGVFDGQAVLAATHSGRMTTHTFSVPRAPGERALSVSARPQGMRPGASDVTTGDATFDAAIHLTGAGSDIALLLDAPARAALREAVTVHGWRLEEGELRRDSVTVHELAAKAAAGARAARLLSIADPSERLARIATSDPVTAMRRRALRVLLSEHAGTDAAKRLQHLAATLDPDPALAGGLALAPAGGLAVVAEVDVESEDTQPS